jgi:hypothetical protein
MNQQTFNIPDLTTPSLTAFKEVLELLRSSHKGTSEIIEHLSMFTPSNYRGQRGVAVEAFQRLSQLLAANDLAAVDSALPSLIAEPGDGDVEDLRKVHKRTEQAIAFLEGVIVRHNNPSTIAVGPEGVTVA